MFTLEYALFTDANGRFGFKGWQRAGYFETFADAYEEMKERIRDNKRALNYRITAMIVED